MQMLRIMMEVVVEGDGYGSHGGSTFGLCVGALVRPVPGGRGDAPVVRCDP